MKTKELRPMNDHDLGSKITELKKELMKINSQVAIGTVPKSPGKIKEMKRAIAKILTIRNENSRNKSTVAKQKGGDQKA